MKWLLKITQVIENWTSIKEPKSYYKVKKASKQKNIQIKTYGRSLLSEKKGGEKWADGRGRVYLTDYSVTKWHNFSLIRD